MEHKTWNTRRDLLAATDIGVRRRAEGARRIPDTLTWHKVTNLDTGLARLTFSDSQRRYRMDADTAVELANAILDAFEDGDANADH